MNRAAGMLRAVFGLGLARCRRLEAPTGPPLIQDRPSRIAMRSPGRPIDALDPDLRAVAGPAEHDDVAALRQRAENSAARRRQHDEGRQRRRAVAVGIFGRQQLVADLQRRLHRAGRHVVRLGDRGLGRRHDQR